MSQLDEQFNTKGIFYLKTALAIFSGSGDHNSVEDGALGCLYIDEATGDLYQKTTAIGTLTGWSVVSGGGGGGTPGGSDTEVQYNHAGAFGGISGATSDGTSLFISALNLQADQPTFLNDVAFIKDAIGVVTDDGINLVNTTAAALGSQQFSPGIRWTGNGWKTSSGGASQAMDAIAQLETVQGAAVPTSNLCFSFQSNGTGYTKRFTFGNTGRLTVDESLVAASVASSIYTSALTNSTYLQLTSGAAASGVTLAVAGGGTNENLILIPKGTGSILIASGSASAPAIAFLAETNMGIYRRYAGQLAVTIGGTDKAIIDANSLNFSSLQYLTLGSVSINNSASNILRLHNTSGTTGSQILLGTSSDTISAQLDVRSQNTTRPAARFQAASTTLGTQEMLGVYDGSGNNVAKVSANGTMRFQQGFQVTNTSDQIKAEISVPSTGYYNTSDMTFNWSGSTTSNATPDLTLVRDAANTLAQRNGTNARTLRVYRAYTDASNYERADLTADGITRFAAGTGTQRNFSITNDSTVGITVTSGVLVLNTTNTTISLQRLGTTRLQLTQSNEISLTAPLIYSADNTYDIGASGANRPRNAYIANNIDIGGNVNLSSNSAYVWNGRSHLRSPSDGIIGLYNNAQSDFDRLQFGGTSASFPSLQRSGTSLKVRLADNSDDAPLTTFTVKTKALTVATLPSAATAGAGARAFVTDANTTFILGVGTTVVGGGSNSVPVYSDGTNWLIG